MEWFPVKEEKNTVQISYRYNNDVNKRKTKMEK